MHYVIEWYKNADYISIVFKHQAQNQVHFKLRFIYCIYSYFGARSIIF